MNPATESRIIHGEAIATLKTLPPACAQAIIADPPYNNVLDVKWDQAWETSGEFIHWMKDWAGEAMRVLRDDGLCFIFGQLGKREHAFLQVMSELTRLHTFHDLIIWDRAVGYNERRDSLTPAYEMVLVLRKSDAVKFNKETVREAYDEKTIAQYLRDKRYKDREAREKHLQQGKFATNILRVPSLKGISKEKCGHPSQKPEALIQKLVLMSTDEGDLVLDPFLGSGTTAIVAHRENRRYLGIEIDASYVAMAKTRLAALTEGALF